VGSKFGVVFNVRHAGAADFDPTTLQNALSEWRSVAVRSILKDHWQDRTGRWRDSIHFFELEPADEENRIELQEFYVAGRFRVVREETDAARAVAAWKAFTPA
jgi:hypothetical protein